MQHGSVEEEVLFIAEANASRSRVGDKLRSTCVLFVQEEVILK